MVFVVFIQSVRQKVTIDVCKVYGSDTVFLQQAAHLTGGSYIHLEKRDALLQYLIVREFFRYYALILTIHLDGSPSTSVDPEHAGSAYTRQNRLPSRLFLS